MFRYHRPHRFDRFQRCYRFDALDIDFGWKMSAIDQNDAILEQRQVRSGDDMGKACDGDDHIG